MWAQANVTALLFSDSRVEPGFNSVIRIVGGIEIRMGHYRINLMKPGQRSAGIPRSAHVNYVNTSTRVAWRSDERVYLFLICFTTGEKQAKPQRRFFALAEDAGRHRLRWLERRGSWWRINEIRSEGKMRRKLYQHLFFALCRLFRSICLWTFHYHHSEG